MPATPMKIRDHADQRPRAVVRFVGYSIIALILLLCLELLSYVAVKQLSKSAIFFDQSLVTQRYAAYLTKRDATLGWQPRAGTVDPVGSRRDPSPYAATEACVDVYGDSFTWGAEVADGEAWASRLTTRLKCRVRNFGVGGYGTDQAYLRVTRQPQHSRIVVLNHLSENIIRNVNQFRNLIYPGRQYALKPRFVVQEGRLVLQPTPDIPADQVDRFLRDPGRYLGHEFFLPNGPSGVQFAAFPYSLKLIGALGHWHVGAILGGAVRHGAFYREDHPSDALRITYRIILSFMADSRVSGVVPVVTIMPTCRDLQFHEQRGYFPYHALSSLMQRSGVDFIDIGEEIHSRVGGGYGRLYRSCSAHFNSEGNELVSRILADYIGREGLLN